MRVLFVIDSLAVGGAERSLESITPFLIERGVDLDVGYLVDREGVGSQLLADGARLHGPPSRNSRPANIAFLRGLIRDVEPDLVHTTLFESDIAGRTAGSLARIPVASSFVTEAYGPEHLGNPEYRRWKVRAAQIADALTARLVTRFHAVSASAAAVMARRLRVDPGRIDVIPRGRSQDQLGTRTIERQNAVRNALGLNHKRIVLAAGRHFFSKGLDVLVESFDSVVSRVPDAHLLIAGREGPSTPDLRRIIDARRLHDSVTLAGYRSDVADLMCAADLFVLPSRAEGSPGVLIEAMGLETPTVATAIPSVIELAGSDDPVVQLTEPESSPAMAGAIVALLEDPHHAAALAQRGRERFLQNYTLERVADRMVGFYERMVG